MAINPKVFKQVRKALGLSQQGLADQLGLSRVTINKMERGKLKRGIPGTIANRLLELKKYREQNPGAVSSGPSGWDVLRQQSADAHLWDNEEDES